MPTRRRFLSLSSASLACASFSHSLFGQSAQRLGIPVFSEAALGAEQQGILTAANFRQLVGSSFHAFLNNDVVLDIVLMAVRIPTQPTPSDPSRIVGAPARPTATAARRASINTNAFMLFFNTGDTLIPQDTYVLDSGTLGSFSTLLVPAQSVSGDQRAIATFNTL